MIAANVLPRVQTHPIHDGVGRSAVTDKVAEIEDLVILSSCVGEHCFERLPVGMDVTKDEITHRRETTYDSNL